MDKNLYIETYGCQMNVNDSEVVASILADIGYTITEDIETANLILLNTCSIRENAENKVFQRLHVLKKLKAKAKTDILIGVIGCMAERLKEQLLDKEIKADIVAGPDSYRDLPQLVEFAQNNTKAINVHLSDTETYSDIDPKRINSNKLSAFISIMRGCNNFCTYCIVPYTRGRERSRDAASIVNEAKRLFENGYKEVTLLGQNVNSFNFDNGSENISFARLLELVAQIDSTLRVRFTTSHPKDLGDDVINIMAQYPNICKNIHLPVQSGSTNVLKKMNRGYTREWYINRIEAIKKAMPECTISTDILSGFCAETEEDHLETLSLMEWVKYDQAFMFKYSERPGTMAHKKLDDDIDDATKTRRLNEIIALQNKLSAESNQADIGKTFEVLVEGVSKKSKEQLFGRTSQNKVVVFPKENVKPGDYVMVKVNSNTSATLIGELL